MKCARLRLQERCRTKPDYQPNVGKEMKPRRYCQKRMVDPAHEEDPRWTNVFQRYHCKKSFEQENTNDGNVPIDDQDDIYLTVQNLKFQGEVQDNKRPRTSFKYRLPPDSNRHRMFIKQVVEDIEAEDDLSSQLTSYYFDDYVKYILSNDRSRPSSSKSSIFLDTIVNGKESKAVQVEGKPHREFAKMKNKKVVKNTTETNEEITDNDIDTAKGDSIHDAKVSYHKSGKRKSLTISRVPSPETVQVIRVDVVCNYSTSSILSDYDDKKFDNTRKPDKIEDIKLKGPHFSNKYLLTNTVKTLDENVSGGAKVTLLCKTFKLSDRLKLFSDRKKTKMAKDVSKLRK
ncbi:uncharacterized protein LOC128683035 [Plodia interpunctella]|uniref:uncharacterized protein LOC128683035 n=1 Tax=Plodia interpunctella TaxID=58824 RepID=UPI00236845FB|nr:uncharacterized protein LOC128683035 [Plodia interpunctella]